MGADKEIKREAKKYKKYLKELTASVKICLDAIAAEMKKPPPEAGVEVVDTEKFMASTGGAVGSLMHDVNALTTAVNGLEKTTGKWTDSGLA